MYRSKERMAFSFSWLCERTYSVIDLLIYKLRSITMMIPALSKLAYHSKSVVADSRLLSCFRSYTEQPLTLVSTIDGTRSQSRRQSYPSSTPPPNHTVHCHNTKSISMPNYLCRPTELNSSSPVLPEGAHSLEHNTVLSCLKTQRI